jgi:hypothetical protein
MKKVMVDVDQIKRLADTERALLCLAQLAERAGRCRDAGATDCDSLATLLNLIIEGFQPVVSNLQHEVDKGLHLQKIPKG